MAASIETKRRLRAIRKLSSPVPDRTAEERLEQIGDVVSGKLDVTKVVNITSPTLFQRLADGQASRSPRTARDKRPAKVEEPEPEPEEEEGEKKRGRRGGRNRQESGGMNRSVDINT